MRKLIAFLISVMAFSTVAMAESDIKIDINGKGFETDVAPTVINDRVLVPMRAIFEEFGADVNWDGETKTIYALSEDINVVLQIGNYSLFKNGEKTYMDVAPIITDDRTLVPLRAVAVSFGAEVDWDAEKRIAYIKYEKEVKKDYGETIAVSIEMEDGRVMTAELYPEIAPKTVENFVKLANEGFYDGLIFHRVIEDFMIQGGGYDKNYKAKETETIVGEFDINGFQNPIKHERGVLSMARTYVPDSASSQFFIVHANSPHLDGQYAAFGILTSGFEVLDEIAAVETKTLVNGMADVPVEPQIIKTIKAEISE